MKSHNADRYIRSKIVLPNRIPIEHDKNSYTEFLVSKVKDKTRHGYDIDTAIRSVNSMYGGVKSRKARHRVKKESRAKKGIIVASSMAVASAIAAGSIFLGLESLSPQSTNAIAISEQEIDLTGTNRDEVILVVGADERPEVDNGSGTKDDVPGIRTDMLALVVVPKDGSRASVVSIPRDTNVDRPQCEEYDYEDSSYTGDTLPSQNDVKINSIYQEGGPKCLVDTIEEVSGLSISRYAQIGFDDFSSIIDAVGGVDIDVQSPVIDDVLGVIVDKPGLTHMNGEQALKYVRARHVQGTGMSDFDRINRQQQVVSSVIESLTKGGASSNGSMLMKIAKDVMPNVSTDNLSLSDSIQIAHTLSSVPRDKIIFDTLPVIDGQETVDGNLIIDEYSSFELFKSITSDSVRTQFQGVEPGSSSQPTQEAYPSVNGVDTL